MIKKFDDFNEGIFSKFLNNKNIWIEKINNLLDINNTKGQIISKNDPYGEEDWNNNDKKTEIIDFFKEFAPFTKYPDISTKLDSLNNESMEELEEILSRLKFLLKKSPIKDIRIYRPNHGSPYWNISNHDMSFSG